MTSPCRTREAWLAAQTFLSGPSFAVQAYEPPGQIRGTLEKRIRVLNHASRRAFAGTTATRISLAFHDARWVLWACNNELVQHATDLSALLSRKWTERLTGVLGLVRTATQVTSMARPRACPECGAILSCIEVFPHRCRPNGGPASPCLG